MAVNKIKPANPFGDFLDQAEEFGNKKRSKPSAKNKVDKKLLQVAAKETGGYRSPQDVPIVKIDGRTLRSKGRTVQFGTKLTPDAHSRMLTYVSNFDGGVADFLDHLMDLYES